MQKKRIAAALTAAALVVAGSVYVATSRTCSPWPECKKPPVVSPSPTVSPTTLPPTTPPPTSPPPAGTKAIVKGVFTRESIPSAGTPVRTATVKVYWDQLEPTDDAFNRAPIATALATAEARGLDGVRLRPQLGFRSPDWAMQLGSGPIPYTQPQNKETVSVPDVWSAAFQAEAAELHAWMAREFDGDPRLKLVYAGAASTYYTEPFIRGISYEPNRQPMLNAGYTMEKDKAAQKWQLDIMKPFVQTPIGLAYNPWQYIKADGSSGTSVAYMAEVMDYHISLFGARTVLQNNSIRASYITNTPGMYQEFINRLGAPGTTQYQMAATANDTNPRATLEWAITYLKASGIELTGAYPTIWTNAQLTDADTRLKAQSS